MNEVTNKLTNVLSDQLLILTTFSISNITNKSMFFVNYIENSMGLSTNFKTVTISIIASNNQVLEKDQ